MGCEENLKITKKENDSLKRDLKESNRACAILTNTLKQKGVHLSAMQLNQQVGSLQEVNEKLHQQNMQLTIERDRYKRGYLDIDKRDTERLRKQGLSKENNLALTQEVAVLKQENNSLKRENEELSAISDDYFTQVGELWVKASSFSIDLDAYKELYGDLPEPGEAYRNALANKDKPNTQSNVPKDRSKPKNELSSLFKKASKMMNVGKGDDKYKVPGYSEDLGLKPEKINRAR